MKGKKIPRKVLQDQIEGLKQKFERSQSQEVDLLERLALLEGINRSLSEQNKSNGYVQMTRKDGKFKEEDFYDGVINVPNIKSILEGWEVKIKDWNRYIDSIKQKGTIVAIVGTYNKGKTFLLGKLSNSKVPEGFNVNSQGISITYLQKDGAKLPIIGLDTKGSALPLDISSISRPMFTMDESVNGLNSLLLQNEKLQEKGLKDLLRDHQATEDILQKFIMDIANLIIVMVSDLNFEDQKLVNKIKKQFKNIKSKKIIVVHNLYHTHYTDDVEYKIKEFIKKGFLLEEVQHKHTNSSRNRTYYVEHTGKDEIIPHIIIAKDYSEAGDYYNEVGLNYIRECINTIDQQKQIDIVENFYKYLQKNLFTYIKGDRDLKINDLVLDREENGQYKCIRLNEVNGIKLQSVFADELGELHVFKDGFRPNYALYDETGPNGENFLCLKIECPEKCSSIKSRIILTTEEFKFQVKGEKGTNEAGINEVLASTRHFGEFYLETDFYKRLKYKFDSNEIPRVNFVDGMLILRWRLLNYGGGGWISTNIRREDVSHR